MRIYKRFNMNEELQLFFDLFIMTEHDGTAYINYKNFLKNYRDNIIQITFKNFIKALLFEIQSKHIQKVVCLVKEAELTNEFIAALDVIKFTRLLHCFTLVLSNKEALPWLQIDYPELCIQNKFIK